ncbi:unnamed protein product, partial [Closterium sp. NIES-53]
PRPGGGRGRGRGGRGVRGGGAANKRNNDNESESRNDRFPGQFFFVTTQAPAAPEKDESFEDPAAVGEVTLHSLDYWVIDSGATYSMTPRANLLTELDPSPVKHVTSTLEQRAEVKGMGKAMFKGAGGKMVGLKNVLWVPNLAANLISVRRLQKAGMDTSSKGAKTYTARLGERILWDLHKDRDVYNEMWKIHVVPIPKERQLAASISTKGKAVGSGDGANDCAKEIESKKCNLGGTSKLGEHEESGAAAQKQHKVEGVKAMFKGAGGKMVGLKNVLWVPKLAANLISVRRLQKAGMDTSSKGDKTYTARLGERILWDLHKDRDVYNEMWKIHVVPIPKERQLAASISTKGEAVGSGDGANDCAKEIESKKCNLGGTSKLGEHEESGAAAQKQHKGEENPKAAAEEEYNESMWGTIASATFSNPTSATGECDWLTLHWQMGHVAMPILQQLVKNEMVAGIRVKGEPDEVLGCPTCMQACEEINRNGMD